MEFPETPLYRRPEGVALRGTRTRTVEIGEQHHTIRVDPGSPLARELYRVGTKTLIFRLTGDGPDGAPFENRQQLDILGEPVDASWWAWTSPSPDGLAHVEWKRPYVVAGLLSNRSAHASLATAVTITEQTLDTVRDIPERLDHDIRPSADAVCRLPEIVQDWSWFLPRVYISTSPFPRHFVYQARVALEDEFGNRYHLESAPMTVMVSIPGIKLVAQFTAMTAAATAAGLLISAALALAGVITAIGAPALAAAAAAAYGVATAAGAVADDPAELDPKFDIEVPLPPRIAVDAQQMGPITPLVELLAGTQWIFMADLASSVIEGKLLGAQQVHNEEWTAVHVRQYGAAVKESLATEERVDQLLAAARPALQMFSVDLANNGLAVVKGWEDAGPDTGLQQVWIDAGLPKEQLNDLTAVARARLKAGEDMQVDQHVDQLAGWLRLYVSEKERYARSQNLV
jgi:hypothetical protein